MPGEISDVNNKAALEKYLAEQKLAPAAGYLDGYAATVLAIKANEAVVKGGKIGLPKEMFELS